MRNEREDFEQGPVAGDGSAPTEASAAARSARDDAVIEALGSGTTHQQAADLLGVSSKTIQRTLADPTIRARVAARRRERMEEITGLLIGASDSAIAALVEVARDGPPRDRVAAAIQLLRLGRQFYSDDLLEGQVLDRIAALESDAAESKDAPG